MFTYKMLSKCCQNNGQAFSSVRKKQMEKQAALLNSHWNHKNRFILLFCVFYCVLCSFGATVPYHEHGISNIYHLLVALYRRERNECRHRCVILSVVELEEGWARGEVSESDALYERIGISAKDFCFYFLNK